MNLFKLFQAIEELIYQMALWIVFIPKTLMQVLLCPSWIYDYVQGEMEKEPEERFAQYLSPVLFFVLVGIIPHLFALDALASAPQSRVAQETEWKNFMTASWEMRLLLVSIFALAGPLAFSLRVKKDQGETINRDTLRKTFYAQCYAFAPTYLFLLPTAAILLFYDDRIPGGFLPYLNTASFCCALGWTIICESSVLSKEHRSSRWGGAGRAISYLWTMLWLTIALELIAITVFNGFRVWLVS